MCESVKKGRLYQLDTSLMTNNNETIAFYAQ